jgi:SAM-dependent methyltransferase
VNRRICYDSVNLAVLTRVPIGAKRVLDIGCGAGGLGDAIKRRQNCVAMGVTHNPEEAERARTLLDGVVVADLNECRLDDAGHFDCVVCSHVLEHVIDPGKLLARLRPQLNPDGVLIVAVPNALFWRQRLQFLTGRFRYTLGGMMDETHLRFFDWQTACQLMERAGYRVIERVADGGFPQPLLRRLIPKLAAAVDSAACSWRPGLFGWQFILVAKVIF